MLTGKLPPSGSKYLDPEGDAPLSLLSILMIFRRQWPIVLIGIVLAGAAAVSFILLSTPLYTADASVIIDTRQNQLLQNQKIMAEGTLDTSVIDSQVEVVSSERLTSDVIRRLRLAEDPEFVGPSKGLTALVKSWIGQLKSTAGLSAPDVATTPERQALELFSKRLSVKRIGLTYVLSISFTSESPEKAAKIANAVANAYVEEDLRAKYDSTKRAGAWLQGRLADLRAQATASDEAVQAFKSKNNLVDTSRGAMNEQQLAELNSQLILISADTAQAKAKLDRISEIRGADIAGVTVSDALSNPVISRLRAQYLDLLTQASQLAARYGDGHQAVRNLRNQMAEIRKSIDDEIKRIADAYKSDYQIAQARESSLRANLENALSTAGLNSEAQVKLRDLESSAETNRALYDSFLQMARQTTQQETFPISDTRVLSDASRPLNKSYPPKPFFLVIGALILGAAAGGAGAFAREFMIDAFRTVGDVERETGTQCLGVLPVVRAPRRRAALQNELIASHVLTAPFSRFTETLRHAKVSIDLQRLASRTAVLGVVSAIPREGKSVVASNLALLCASLGHRALLIDGDLHARSLTAVLGRGAKKGIIEAIGEPDRLSEFVIRDRFPNLDLLPCYLERRLPEAAELLSSPQMARLLAVARETYDYIIIDFPPIVPVVDAKAASHLVDSFLLVIDWGRTTRTVVVEGLASADVIKDRVIGTVLNKADPVALKRIEAYKGRGFQDYYIEPAGRAAAAPRVEERA